MREQHLAKECAFLRDRLYGTSSKRRKPSDSAGCSSSLSNLDKPLWAGEALWVATKKEGFEVTPRPKDPSWHPFWRKVEQFFFEKDGTMGLVSVLKSQIYLLEIYAGLWQEYGAGRGFVVDEAWNRWTEQYKMWWGEEGRRYMVHLKLRNWDNYLRCKESQFSFCTDRHVNVGLFCLSDTSEEKGASPPSIRELLRL